MGILDRKEKLEYLRNSLEILKKYKLDTDVNTTEFEIFKDELLKQLTHNRADRLKNLVYYEVNEDNVPF